jgi:ParB family transcriptional regulator, chromosome partitioning protein
VSARRSGLGKGLASLIPASATASVVELDTILEVPLSAIEPNPHQPRSHFETEGMAELAASIRELGVLQPVLLRPVAEGSYQLIAGERRWRAAQQAGLTTIPAIVREADEERTVAEALVENLQREDLSALEEASAFQQLIEEFGLTHDEVAARVGKSRSAVSNTMRLLQLPPAILHLLADGRLTAGHARALLATPDRAFQEQLARRAAAEEWSVRQVEDAVRARGGEPDQKAPARSRSSKLRPPGLLELEELLAAHLDTRVAISMGTGKGKVMIEFADLADLERIYRAMTEVGNPQP